MTETPETETFSVSAVVPVFNGERTLTALAERLDDVLRRHAKDYEILLIDDGSNDGSWAVIRELARRFDRVRGIRLMRNYGQHNALLRAIREARCEVIVTLDDDLQNPPEEIPKLLGRIVEGYDVVYGAPQERKQGLLRGAASESIRLLLRSVLPGSVARNVSAFRAFRAVVRKAFERYDSPFVSIDVLLTWGTTRIGAVTVEHHPRRVGRSNYGFLRLLGHALDVVTGFSTWPLRVASLIGFAFTLFGAGVLVFVVGRYLLLGYSVPGFPFLASVIAIFAGAQLFALGIIGEYLARMHFRSMRYPDSVERERVEPGPADS